MGTGGDLWDTLDLISAARMNQKTVYIKDTAPSVTYPGQLWFDTSVNKLKIRNAANTGWIDTFPPASHTHVASDVTSGTFDLARIPNMDWAHISGVFPRSISDVISSAFSRSWISDFFSTPFWDNIPDKPSTFPPSSHVHDASEITSGVLDEARVPHTFSSPIWFNADINCRHIALQSNYSIYPYSADNSTYLWLLSYYSEEYYPRFQIDISGKMGWGSGSASPDVNLYRYAADVLKTDDTLDVYALRISGTTVIDSSRRLVGLASVYQSLTPTSSSAYNLGSSTYRWNYLYVNYAYLYSGLYMGGTQVMDASRNLLNIAGISCTGISLAGSLDMYNGPRYLYMRSNLSSDGDIGYIHFKNDYTNKIMEILSTIRSGKYYIEYYYYDGSNWYFLGSIDQDKNWRFEGEAILNFNRTRITGFDGSYFHWIRSSSDDSKLWMAFVASDAQGSPSRIHMNQNITVAGGKVFRFLGNSSGTLSDLGYIEFYDSYFSGGRNLQMKGIYETDGKYYFQWYYWDGANWLSLMRLSQDGTLIGKNIQPLSTSTYDLGSPSSMWRFLYSYIPINYYSGPSTTILRRDDTAVYGYETTMTKKKEIYLSFIVPTTCTLNIYFELFANYDPGWGQDTAYGRIYRNGSPYGTLRTV
ncbi:MAG: hypothetical protein OH337_03745, partial [Candidatus Parvarchaeota archaeon]|nr:hypothetical protein [Candidatus Haiyanarchaeum thermophilum]